MNHGTGWYEDPLHRVCTKIHGSPIITTDLRRGLQSLGEHIVFECWMYNKVSILSGESLVVADRVECYMCQPFCRTERSKAISPVLWQLLEYVTGQLYPWNRQFSYECIPN